MATDPSTRPPSTIYIGGLDTTSVSASTLSTAFVPFGEIVDISLPKPEAPSSTELHRGFGYIEFEEATDAKEAIDNMDQSELMGRVIKVAMAKPEQRKGEMGGGQKGQGATTAVWEQEGYAARYGGEQGQGGEVGGEVVEVGEKGEDPMQGLEGLDVAGPRVK